VRTVLLGDRDTIAGTVYGTIVVLATLAAGARSFRHELWELSAIAGSTVAVLWIAHVYAHGLGESVNEGHRLTLPELGQIAFRELAILLAAVPVLGTVALGALGILRHETALWLAFGVGVLSLAVQGVRYARLERLSRTGAAVTIGLNLALGLVIVALKVAVTH
jgi:membrane-associated PAP2 superfamily phosphatase